MNLPTPFWSRLYILTRPKDLFDNFIISYGLILYKLGNIPYFFLKAVVKCVGFL